MTRCTTGSWGALASILAFSVLGCSDTGGKPDGSVEPQVTSAFFAPNAEYPERSLLPLPNILALNTKNTPPTLSIKSTMCFKAGSRTEATLTGLEGLNGFGTYSKGSILAYFGGELDAESLVGRLLLVDLGTFGGDGSDADLANPIPVATQLTETPKFLEGCSAAPVMVPTMVVIPYNPTTQLPVVLKGNHQYALALLDGILDANGNKVRPFYVWVMVRDEQPIIPDPSKPDEYQKKVALKQIQDIHHPVLDAFKAMGHPRQEIILAWTFNTQFIDTALQSIGSRLGSLGEAHDRTTVTIPAAALPIPPLPPANFLPAMGLSCVQIGAGPDCPGIGSFISGQFVSPSFQQQVSIPQPYQQIAGGPATVPGTFTSTTQPAVQGTAGKTIAFLASTPKNNAGPYPVVIFQHPLTPTDPQKAQSASRLALFAVANGLGAGGLAAVAIDSVLAGDRKALVQNTLEATTELYPIINSDIFVTRDNIRQTAVDLMQLVRVLKDCTPATCGGLNIDANKIYFLGTSMGGVIGSVFAALSPDVNRAVFNATGAGLVELLAKSNVLVPELAASLCRPDDKIISAACCSTPSTCTPEDLAADPAFAQFKLSAQWIIDPGDPVNYAATLAASIAAGGKRVLVQEATGDQVFPNQQTGLWAGLLGLSAGTNYKSYDPGACGQLPEGAHVMLLNNCGAGTAAMQTDLVTFFLTP